MARITAGHDFGHQVAQPQSFDQRTLSRAAFGVNEGMTRRGAQMEAEGLRLEANQAREVEMADRAKAQRLLTSAGLDYEEAAKDFSERVRTGVLPRDEADSQWRERTAELNSRLLEGVPRKHAEAVSAALQDHQRRYGMRVGDAVKERVKDETRADLDTSLQNLSRLSTMDRAGAIAVAEQSITALGPHAGLDPYQQQQTLMRFRERAAEVEAKRMIRGARGDMGALDAAEQALAGETFGDLTPEKREQLETQLQNRRIQLEHAQQVAALRAQAAAERRSRDAEDATKAVQTIIDSGGMVDEETLATAQTKTAGTPWATALHSLVGQGKERAGFASMLPDQQREALLALRAKANRDGTSPALEKRIATLEGIADKSDKAIEADPLTWAQANRMLEQVQPLRFETLDQLMPQLAMRVDQAQTVGSALKRPVSPLLAAEAQRVAEVLAVLPVPQRARAVRTLAQQLPPEQQRALAAQVKSRDNALALAMFASSAPSATGADVPTLILRGADARRGDRLKGSGEAASRDHVRIAHEIAQVPWATTQERDAATEAAQLVYDGERDAKGGGSGNWRAAVTNATGGLAEWGEQKVPVPPGWTPDRFRSAMRRVDAVALQSQFKGPVFIGGAEVKAEDLAKAMGVATLIPVGPGRYAIDAGGVVMAGNRPFVFTLRD